LDLSVVFVGGLKRLPSMPCVCLRCCAAAQKRATLPCLGAPPTAVTARFTCCMPAMAPLALLQLLLAAAAFSRSARLSCHHLPCYLSQRCCCGGLRRAPLTALTTLLLHLSPVSPSVLSSFLSHPVPGLQRACTSKQHCLFSVSAVSP